MCFIETVREGKKKVPSYLGAYTDLLSEGRTPACDPLSPPPNNKTPFQPIKGLLGSPPQGVVSRENAV